MSSKNIRKTLYRIYYKLPPKVRAFLFPAETLFYSVKEALFFLSKFRLCVYLLQGREKWSGNSLTTLFLGDERGVLFFSDLLFSEEPKRESLGKVFIWRIKARLNLDLPKADLTLIKMDGFFSRFLARHGFIIIPEWILFMMDLSDPPQGVWKFSRNKSTRENVKEIKKQNYSYEMTRDPSKFEYFYHHMYLPLAWKRFGKVTVLTNFRDMEKAFKKGQLLLIKGGNEYVSGNVLKIDHDTVFSVSLGVKEGKTEYLKAGASTACYYFTILWAKEQGYKWLDFGHCRSFFKDGVFDYKKRWGMDIKLSTRVRTVFGMKVCNFRQGVKTFLEKNPFIFVEQEKLKGLILVDEDHPLVPEEVQSLVKAYSIPGLDCLVILSDQGFTKQAEEFANSCSTQRLHLISAKAGTFFETFPHILQS